MTLLIIIALILGCFLIFALFNYKKRGKIPGKTPTEQITQSPHYQDGGFKNLTPTIQLTNQGSKFKLFTGQLVDRQPRKEPKEELPSVKTNLKAIPLTEDTLIWFGHSSYYIQIDGKRILVDPIFASHLSPIPGFMTAFKGTNIYSADDIPEIDYLFITHDHWDHLNYDSIKALQSKVRQVICPLGVGEHLKYWGYPAEHIVEADWYAEIPLGSGFTTYTIPSRHFSGRWLKPNQTLWTSFVLQTPTLRLFLGGDGGYDRHFAAAGQRFGGFDLALIENGQYNENWKYIHMFPDQVVQAAKDLQTKRFIPIHSGRFALARHPWDEPLKRVTEIAKEQSQPILTPRIGERVNLKDSLQTFGKWWEGIE